MNKNTWNNLFNVRGDNSGTQSITKQVIDKIKELVWETS